MHCIVTGEGGERKAQFLYAGLSMMLALSIINGKRLVSNNNAFKLTTSICTLLLPSGKVFFFAFRRGLVNGNQRAVSLSASHR